MTRDGSLVTDVAPERLARDRWIGKRHPRVEDGAFLRGLGRYIDDLNADRMLHLSFVRSPVARGTISGIDVSAALAVEGVHSVLTADDLADYKGLRAEVASPFFRAIEMPLLAGEDVCYSGQPVAAVLANSPYVAEDAADAVVVDIAASRPVMDIEEALASDAAPIHPEAPGNTFIDTVVIDDPDIDEVFENAYAVVESTFRTGRVTAVPLEGRGCLAEIRPEARRLRLFVSTQIPHMLRSSIADVLGVPEAFLHVVAPDVGGGFGQKGHVSTEEVVVAAAALRTGRSVKWVEDRRENLTAASQGHEQRTVVRAAFSEAGEILAIDATVENDVGAFSCYPFSSGIEPMMAARELPGVYRMKHYRSHARAVVTNKSPMGPYRGVGRPQIVFVTERLMDKAARVLELSRSEIRRRNLIRSGDFPYTGPNGVTYDEGSYVESMEKCLDILDFGSWPERQEEARREGRLIGLGFSCFSEFTGYGTSSFAARGLDIVPGYETAVVEIDPSGQVTAAVGASAHGQGHQTMLAQVIADVLGVTPEDVTVREGDTDVSPYGWGTFASRGAVATGDACYRAARKLADRVKVVAAHLMDVAPESVQLRGGMATASDDRYLALGDIARIAHLQSHRLPDPAEPGLVARASFDPPGTFSNACHGALVDVDPHTGGVTVERFVVVEDCGVMLNPMIVEGQVRGGVAQGIAKALYEEVVYGEDGQCLTATFLDYLVPTAAEIPPIEIHHIETPCASTETGAKGMGEGGTIGAPAAVANAVVDAIAHLGIELDSIPITPSMLLTTLRRASAQSVV